MPASVSGPIGLFNTRSLQVRVCLTCCLPHLGYSETALQSRAIQKPVRAEPESGTDRIRPINGTSETVRETLVLQGVRTLGTSDFSRLGTRTSQDLGQVTSQDLGHALLKTWDKLGTSDFARLRTREFSRIGTSVFSKLGTSDFSRFGTSDFSRIVTSDISRVLTSDFSKLGTSDYSRLGTSDLSRRGTSDFSRLGTNVFSRLGKSDFSRLGTSDFSRVGTNDFSRLGTSDFSHDGTSEPSPTEIGPCRARTISSIFDFSKNLKNIIFFLNSPQEMPTKLGECLNVCAGLLPLSHRVAACVGFCTNRTLLYSVTACPCLPHVLSAAPGILRDGTSKMPASLSAPNGLCRSWSLLVSVSALRVACRTKACRVIQRSVRAEPESGTDRIRQRQCIRKSPRDSDSTRHHVRVCLTCCLPHLGYSETALQSRAIQKPVRAEPESGTDRIRPINGTSETVRETLVLQETARQRPCEATTVFVSDTVHQKQYDRDWHQVGRILKRLGTSDFARLRTREFSRIGTSVFSKLGTSDFSRFGTSDFSRIVTSDISRVLTSDFSKLGTSDYSRLGTSDLSRRGTSDFSRLGTNVFSRLGKSDFSRLGTSDFSRVGTNDFSRLGTSDFSHDGTSEPSPTEIGPCRARTISSIFDFSKNLKNIIFFLNSPQEMPTKLGECLNVCAGLLPLSHRVAACVGFCTNRTLLYSVTACPCLPHVLSAAPGILRDGTSKMPASLSAPNGLCRSWSLLVSVSALRVACRTKACRVIQRSVRAEPESGTDRIRQRQCIRKSPRDSDSTRHHISKPMNRPMTTDTLTPAVPRSEPNPFCFEVVFDPKYLSSAPNITTARLQAGVGTINDGVSQNVRESIVRGVNSSNPISASKSVCRSQREHNLRVSSPCSLLGDHRVTGAFCLHHHGVTKAENIFQTVLYYDRSIALPKQSSPVSPILGFSL
ncbi:Antho-RFamide neuropeptide type 2 [Zootermopsis nevadensis]|uniref:Antho-RFamide neuropeptide type 2 n=1 Tax=Zootermopsis nevadensis TaxID=136037 RepID=A0A067RKQ4_ZOONE|nr:Antho-RFamide neuropeptide type 2 [Zootermopsis nevadensis]